MNIKCCVALALAAVLAGAQGPTPAFAFDLTGAGARFGSVDPEGRDMTPTFGAHLEFQSVDSRVHLQPGFLYWSKERLSDVNPNMDLYYHFAPAGQVSPYLGAGVGLHFYAFDGAGDPGTDAGANLLGGVLFPASSTSFFIEGRYAATDRSQASILAGFTARLGH